MLVEEKVLMYITERFAQGGVQDYFFYNYLFLLEILGRSAVSLSSEDNIQYASLKKSIIAKTK